MREWTRSNSIKSHIEYSTVMFQREFENGDYQKCIKHIENILDDLKELEQIERDGIEEKINEALQKIRTPKERKMLLERLTNS